MQNPDFFDFTNAELLTWVCLLCECSKSNHSEVTLHSQHIHRQFRIQSKTLHNTITKLRQRNIIDVLEESHVTDQLRTRAATQQYKTVQTGQDSKKTQNSKSGDLLIFLWNEFVKLPKVKHVTAYHRKLSSESFSEKPDLDFWKAVFKMIEDSPFLRGEGKAGWKADFCWVMNKGNWARIADGVFNKKNSMTETDWKEIFKNELPTST